MGISAVRTTLLGLMAATLVACATTSVKSTQYVQIVQDTAPVSEDLLMDIGVTVFDPGIDELSRKEEERVSPEIRNAEARYAPYMLAETLQRSGNWGVVRVLPNETTTMDVYLHGQILQSDGEGMIIKITARDSTGRLWYTKEYEEHISKFNYEASQRQANDPFQVIYNNIANDLLAWRKANLKSNQIANIRAVSELQFARNFAPEIFGEYLRVNNRGITEVVRLPADNDPSLARIREIRQRDNLFVDTVQDYYANYARQMRVPYDSWREQSFIATEDLEKVEASARRRLLMGTAAIVGGIAAATSNNAAVQTGSLVGVGAGAYMVKSSFDKRAEAEIHIAALQELGESLESEVAPKMIDLDDRQVMLTGTVEEQYKQWREILVDLYHEETGGI
ncbi:MAG: hypothetical protein KDI28_06805 [Pseudomonadales bacterium]|nr:hypothetical protein [Pseudomonadales bacterium]MCP5357671.1 hypothetical protein [Pseudomonadales bacterium]